MDQRAKELIRALAIGFALGVACTTLAVKIDAKLRKEECAMGLRHDCEVR